MQKTTKLFGSILIATGLMMSRGVCSGCPDYADFFKEFFGCAVRELPYILQFAGVGCEKIDIATRIAEALLELLTNLMKDNPDAFNELVRRCQDEVHKITRSTHNAYDDIFYAYGFLNDDGSVNRHTKQMVLVAVQNSPENPFRRVTRSIGFCSKNPSYTITSLENLLKNGTVKPLEKNT